LTSRRSRPRAEVERGGGSIRRRNARWHGRDTVSQEDFMTRIFRVWLVFAASIVFAQAYAANHTVTVTSNVFSPPTLTIRAGDTVTWVNVAGTHNVLADDGSFTSGSPAPAPWSFSRTFTAAGTVGYHCTSHGGPGFGMFGTIVVLDAIEVEHGSDVQDNLAGTPDRYRIGQTPFSSYEIVVDAVAGNPTLNLERVSGVTVLQTGVPVTGGIDQSQSLRWVNATAASVDTERIRISNGVCTTTSASCSGNDVYRLRAYETTYAIPRFNNSGSQVTVLILQNPADYTITGSIYFWSAAGTMLNAGGMPFTLTAKNALVLPTNTVAGVSGASGTVTIVHNGRYGDLAGKAVALEPATGFSFDSPGIYRIK
jgi:plastocyanin